MGQGQYSAADIQDVPQTGQYSAADLAPPDQQAEKPGFFQRAAQAIGIPTSGEEAKSAAMGMTGAGFLYNAGKSAFNAAKYAYREGKEVGQNIKEGGPILPNLGKAAAAVLPGAAAVAPVGSSVLTMGQDIADKNYAGAAGGAAGILTNAALAKAGGETPAAAATAKNAVNAARVSSVVSQFPDIGKLPPKVVLGTEDIIRAAAPTGMNKGFRVNVYAATGDLADIGRELNLKEAAGGVIQPDMRVRATVEAMRDHLNQMYQEERAPQIQRNANLPVSVGQSADAKMGLEFLQSTAPENIRDAATAALNGGKLTVAQANDLAIAANQNLKTFERATPEVKLQLQTTSPKIGGLKQLDMELGRNLNDVLTANGEVGLRDYERRFAALSAIRDQLESRMNAAELERQGLGKYVRAVTGGPKHIASASQATIADVNIGRRLQNAFNALAESDLTAKKPDTSGAQQ